MPTISVDVDVDLDDFEDSDLLEEVRSRGIGPEAECDYAESAVEMFYAFLLGKPDRAMELARLIAQAVTGRILP